MTTDIEGRNIDGRRARVVAVPKNFDFAVTAYSHGWCALAPNHPDPSERTLERPWRVAGGSTRIRMEQPRGRGGAVELRVVGGRGARAGLAPADWARIERDVGHMLRLDEDLSAFHALCRAAGGQFAGAARIGFGRLLRSPTLFEDVARVLATTNTTWSGTKSMLRKLVDVAGVGGTFPEPAEVAALGTARLRDDARWGYRAAYLARLAEALAEGTLDLTAWERWQGTTEELEREIRRVPGLGPYAAAHVLALLGRYDRIGVDTVFRTFVKNAHFPRARKPVSDRRMLDVYRSWGEWRMLAYWYELWSDYPGPSPDGAER